METIFISKLKCRIHHSQRGKKIKIILHIFAGKDTIKSISYDDRMKNADPVSGTVGHSSSKDDGQGNKRQQQDDERGKKKQRRRLASTPTKLWTEEIDYATRFRTIRHWIAQPIDALRDEDGIFRDPAPALLQLPTRSESGAGDDDTGVLIGNKYHASNVAQLLQLGVTAVLNCASGGISHLPIDDLKENGITYHFTNVRQDDIGVSCLAQTRSI